MLRGRRIFLGACALALLAATAAAPLLTGQAPERVRLTLLSTTDLHGNLFPIDYYANRPAERGLAKIATLVRRVRAEQPNTLLLDCGDTIQGTPLAFYFARKDTSQPNPTIAVMNALGYDAMAVGNHEFNFGLEVLRKARREAKFPFLAANIRQRRPDAAGRFLPYVIKNVAGVRVGIIGFITPGVPRWEIPDNYRNLVFEPIIPVARRMVPEVRKRADLVVVIAHSGLGRGSQPAESSPEEIPGENAVQALAEQVPGIDLIFYGHSHREMGELRVNGVLLAQARNWGMSLARADVELERSGSAWRVATKQSRVIPVTPEVPPDAEVTALAQPYHDATQKYLDMPVATSSAALDGATARYEDHPFVDLIHKVQMEYGKADVSLATMLFSGARVPQGQVTVRQIASIYIYENSLYTVRMTGAELRKVLEHAAGFFPAWPFPEGERVRLPGYNSDSAEGVSYKVDLTRPAGARILDLKYRGRPLEDAARLRVAVNNYRYAGGGNYPLKGLPIVYRSPQEVRELIIEYVSRRKVIPTDCNRNWELLPREAFAGLVEEARRRDAPGGAQ